MTRRWAPFAWGFRPFFLLAGIYAVVAVAGWMLLYASGAAPFGAMPPSLWHAHEMCYGFVGAAIAGFLLTAAPNWTGDQSIAGKPLMALALAWLLGRAGLLLSGTLPGALVIALAVPFLPGVCFALRKSLRQRRHLPLLILVLAYWLSDLVFLWGVFAQSFDMARVAIDAGIDIVLILVTIIGGRIIPVFTANALRARGLDIATPSSPQFDRIVLFAMLLYLLAGILQVPAGWMVIVAGAAGALQLWRFARWNGHRSWPEPIVWVLHVAYVALPCGLLLRAGSAATGAVWAAHWQHVLTIGAASTMILAVMTRAALGHTGRRLRVARSVALGYAALVLAALVRAFGPAIMPSNYLATVMLAGSLWLVAFGVFTVVYAPILTRSRADGKPG